MVPGAEKKSVGASYLVGQFQSGKTGKKRCGNPGGLQNVEVLLRNLVASFAAAAAANGFRAYKVFAHAFPREERSRVRNITYTFKNLLGP